MVTRTTHCKPLYTSIQVFPVVSAKQMYEKCFEWYDKMDDVIDAEAVADYRPKEVANQKIKKGDDNFVSELEKTQYILSDLSEEKKQQFFIGFALETENEIENAKSKIQKKNLDLIVLNSLQDEGAGFGKSTNKITFIDKNFTV